MKLVLAFTFIAALAAAQQIPPSAPSYYRIDYQVREIEGGKVSNQRAYSMSITANTGERASLQTLSRLPYRSGNAKDEFQYASVGSIILTTANDAGPNRVALKIEVDMTNAVKPEQEDLPPVTRQVRWASTAVVPLRKPTIVYSSDDPSGARKVQLEVVVTPE